MNGVALAIEAGTDVQPVDENAWVERVREGELEAFDMIMMRYEERLLRFLIGYVGDVESARELCQDVFLDAYRAVPRTHGELRLSAWLHTIALNKARSHHRRWRFRRTVPFKDDILPSHAVDLQQSAATQDAVQRALIQIPKHYAEVLLLQAVSGLTCREIARVVKCSEGAVKVRLLRAREAFKRAYNREDAEG